MTTHISTVVLTKTLLRSGAAAGPLFVVTGLGQALTRDGFDLRHNTLSLLSNGDLGWIQVTNFVLSGVLYVAGAVGLRRSLSTGRGSTWGPRLLASFGVCMIASGVFRADPAFGFPPGTPDGKATTTSWHSALHYTFASLAFVALVAAFVVLARRLSADGRRGLATTTRVIAVAMAAATVLISSAAEESAVNISFVATALVAFTWASVLAGYANPAPDVDRTVGTIQPRQIAVG
jgi:hypothetical membrane protein